MPVTEKEQASYTAFIRDELIKLGAIIEPADRRPVWHYTNAEGLIGILSTHQLRATANDCLNDSTEISYAEGLYRRAIRDLLKSGEYPEGGRLFLERMVNYLDTSDAPPEDPVENSYYIVCFSSQDDDLSQWRAYGGPKGEGGYAISFAFEGFDAQQILKVNYDAAEHARAAKRLALATVDFYLKGLEVRGDDRNYVWYEEFVPIWDYNQYWLAPVVKHQSFKVENEFRFIIRQPGTDHHTMLGFSPKRSFISRYIMIPQYARSEVRIPLPIVEVKVGPGKHQREAMRSVKALLRRHGYDCKVTLSNSPAQRD